MPIFLYDAVDRQGAKYTGELEAENELSVKRQLQKQNLIPVGIKQHKNKSVLSSSGNKISIKELEYFTNELSLLLISGVKIDKGLDIISRTDISAALKKLVSSLLKDVKSGRTLFDAFSAHPKHFDKMYCNLIRVGEATGELGTVFSKLAADIKFRANLRSQIIQSLVYPLIISFICIAAIIFILNYVIPQMSSLFDEAANLPSYTIALLAFSDWFVKYQFILYCIVIGGGYYLWINRDSQYIKSKLYKLIETIPGAKTMVIMIERIRFTSAMSLMMSSGVKVAAAMDLACQSVKSQAISNSLSSAIEKVKQGQSLTSSLANVVLFEGMYLSLIEIGEETSELERIFSEISQRSQASFESWIAKATNLIEPLLIVLMGLIVGSVVVIMLLSVTSVNDIQF